jgi:hypothetical protein
MKTRIERLVELSARSKELIELRYGDDDDGIDPATVAAGVGGAGLVGAGGLYLRNRGDAINRQAYKRARTALPSGVEGPILRNVARKDFMGSSLGAVKTGAKDVLSSLKGSFSGLGKKLALTRMLGAKDREARLIELKAKSEKLITLGK